MALTFIISFYFLESYLTYYLTCLTLYTNLSLLATLKVNSITILSSLYVVRSNFRQGESPGTSNNLASLSEIIPAENSSSATLIISP